ncbi:stage II sporulation protein D [Pseudoflavonifractor sp. An85]|uniref:stage II sporulation protein D n=1 Tax=Pseudoflavonifractor sp. An85 TaxID=1965661 RepID=UPI001FA82724|nr:stage II sporulation protein D [Pseudoflavonifractor sp. An85]
MARWPIHGEVTRMVLAGVLMGISTLCLFPLLALGQAGGEGEPMATLPASPLASEAQQSQPVQTWDSSQTLRVLLGEGQVEEMTMGEYLWRVVAAEMPASFEPQALRAQAVCARTYSLWKMGANSHQDQGADICADSGCCQAYIDPQKASENWGDNAQGNTEKITQAISDTDGQVMTYDGKPIQAVFFSSSTSSTEDAQAVWGNSLPYLVSVSSPEGEEVPNYYSTVTLSREEVEKKVKEAYPDADLSGDPAGWLSGMTLTASGRVGSMKVGGVELSGGAVRTLFGLRSTCFQVTYQEEKFTFSVTGYGHGVGMSQYGANTMAAEGSSWQDILTHYYTGVTIETKS